MAEQIKVTSQELRKAGENYKTFAKNYEKLVEMTARRIVNVSADIWSGEAQKEYAKKMQEIQKDIKGMTDHIGALDKSFDNAASQFDTAEKKNTTTAGQLPVNVFD